MGRYLEKTHTNRWGKYSIALDGYVYDSNGKLLGFLETDEEIMYFKCMHIKRRDPALEDHFRNKNKQGYAGTE